MIVTHINRLYNLITFAVDSFPDHRVTFDIHELANTSQTIDKLKNKLRDLQNATPTPPADPYAQKFNTLKAAIEGTDIGDL